MRRLSRLGRPPRQHGERTCSLQQMRHLQQSSLAHDVAKTPHPQMIAQLSPPSLSRTRKNYQPNKMEAAAAGDSSDPPLEPRPEDPSPMESSSSATAVPPGPAAPPGAREVAAAMEAVERDAAAIADSYASLFASLRVALSNVTSTSAENIECLGDVVGYLQESALEASSKGNKYINSCLRLNEEMRGLESLAMQLKTLRKNVDSLDLAVNQLLRLP